MIFKGAAPMRSNKNEIMQLFSHISKHYDFLNMLFSLGIDDFWRKQAVEQMPDGGPYLDLCAGTLELSIQLKRKKGGAKDITALDFCPDMLLKGRKKILDTMTPLSAEKEIKIIVGDAESLPIKGGLYQGVIIGFGIRNITNRLACLEEVFRVLKPSGGLVILEFSIPVSPLFKWIYLFYFSHIMPIVGNLLVGRKRTFEHLRDSVLIFPDCKGVARMMSEAGFLDIGCRAMTFGIVCIHRGRKPIPE